MATGKRLATSRSRTGQDAPAAAAKSGTRGRAEKIRRNLDGLIEEIDEALEENAEELVRNYVQRGGE